MEPQGAVSSGPRVSRWRSSGRWLATGVVTTVLCLALSLATGIIIYLQGGAFSAGILSWAEGLVGVGDGGSDTPWFLLVLFVVGVVGAAVGLLIIGTGLIKGTIVSARAARESPHLARGAAAAERAGRATVEYTRVTAERTRPGLRRASYRARAFLARKRGRVTPELTAAGATASVDGAPITVHTGAELEMD
jgi:hypothetical protein